MNLKPLFEMQRVLRDRIRYNESDRFDKLILALLVEIGECANEWRGFKFWSKNQSPPRILHTTQGATPENAVYFKCMNEDDCGKRLGKDDFNSLLDPDYEECPICKVGYVYPFREKNPLLEEYVDGLHFVLELGIELDFEYDEWIYDSWVVETITEQFMSLQLTVGEIYCDKHDGCLPDLISYYIGLGEMLGFTWEQIEQAYMEKNAINHQRQESGY
ncbi:dUTP diphosphatase [Heyndrickxia sp. FSL W8-0496]|uniref:dUTP diphosphatase n=1 Tax=Heyndrickxia sp. FSL W8-0496 TaxID=2954702 RepID=UPI0030FD0390